MHAHRIVCCESHSGDPDWRWVAPHFADHPIDWEFFHRLPRTALQRKIRTPDLALIDASSRSVASVRSRGADLLVSHEPRTTLWCSALARLHRLRVPHVAHAFNFCYLPTGLAILHHSRFMVLPLDSGVVPCGHITMVSSMHLAKAFIATNSLGISDYATHNHNCLIVPPANPDTLAAAIRTLWHDTAHTDALARAGHDFARRHCTEESTVAHVRSLLTRFRLIDTNFPPRHQSASARVTSPSLRNPPDHRGLIWPSVSARNQERRANSSGGIPSK